MVNVKKILLIVKSHLKLGASQNVAQLRELCYFGQSTVAQLRELCYFGQSTVTQLSELCHTFWSFKLLKRHFEMHPLKFLMLTFFVIAGKDLQSATFIRSPLARFNKNVTTRLKARGEGQKENEELKTSFYY